MKLIYAICLNNIIEFYYILILIYNKIDLFIKSIKIKIQNFSRPTIF